jgi:hypothetical protein
MPIVGNPKNLTSDAQKKGVESIKLKARTNDQNRQAQAVIINCIAQGMNYTDSAKYLNSLNYRTSKNKTFQATTVMRLYQRHLCESKNELFSLVA